MSNGIEIINGGNRLQLSTGSSSLYLKDDVETTVSAGASYTPTNDQLIFARASTGQSGLVTKEYNKNTGSIKWSNHTEPDGSSAASIKYLEAVPYLTQAIPTGYGLEIRNSLNELQFSSSSSNLGFSVVAYASNLSTNFFKDFTYPGPGVYLPDLDKYYCFVNPLKSTDETSGWKTTAYIYNWVSGTTGNIRVLGADSLMRSFGTHLSGYLIIKVNG